MLVSIRSFSIHFNFLILTIELKFHCKSRYH